MALILSLNSQTPVGTAVCETASFEPSIEWSYL